MNHLYEELARRKALIEQVNKLQSEVNELDSARTVHDSSRLPPILTSTQSSPVQTRQSKPTVSPQSVVLKNPSTQPPEFSGVSMTVLHSPVIASKLSPDTCSLSQSLAAAKCHESPKPPGVNSFQSFWMQVPGGPIPVSQSYLSQGVPSVNSSNIAIAPKTKQTTQHGNAYKKVSSKARTPTHPNPVVSLSVVSSIATIPLPSSQLTSSITSPVTTTSAVRQPATACHFLQPLVTSPFMPVISSRHPASERLASLVVTSTATPLIASRHTTREQSAPSVVTSPVTPTPTRHFTSEIQCTSSTPASCVTSSEIPSMVSFVQNGLSCIAPLSPLSGISSLHTPISRGTPLSSLSESTQKYLNTFVTQSSTVSIPSQTTFAQRQCTPSSQFVDPGKRPLPNTDLSTDHSAGIKLLCDLLNDTLPEQPPPLLATSVAVRSLGSPSSMVTTSLATSGSADRKYKRREAASLDVSFSSSTPLRGNNGVPTNACEVSAMNQTPPGNRMPRESGTQSSPTGKRRNSPFSIEDIVSPEIQRRKPKSPDSGQAGAMQTTPVSTKRGSPVVRNKSPSTNFSIAHITRNINSPNVVRSPRSAPEIASSGGIPLIIGPETGHPQQRRVSPPAPRVSGPADEKRCRIESTEVKLLNKAGSTRPSQELAHKTRAAFVTDPAAYSVVPTLTSSEANQHTSRVSVPAKSLSSTVISRSVSTNVPSLRLPAKEAALSVNSSFSGAVAPERGSAPVSDPSKGSITSNRRDPAPANEVAEVDHILSEATSSMSPVGTISSRADALQREKETGASDGSSPSDHPDSGAMITDIPLDTIPLPTGGKPSPNKTHSNIHSTEKRSSPGSHIPKSTSPDTEVSSLMARECLPQSPSISSSVSRSGPTGLESRTPVLVDSNPCSACSPIPVATSPNLQALSGVSLPSFGSVFSLAKEAEAVSADKPGLGNRYTLLSALTSCFNVNLVFVCLLLHQNICYQIM